MKNKNLFVSAALSLLPLAVPAGAADRMIFGEDDRVEIYQMPEKFRAAADSTVSLWKKNSLTLDTATGEYKLAVYKFGLAYNLCGGTKFMEQPVGANCSGALVGEDLVVTAGHCVVTAADCANTKFVFGFAMNPDGSARTSVPAGEVYGCARILARENSSVTTDNDGESVTVQGPDYALIQLDHKVSGHKPLPVDRSAGPKKGDRVFVTGHPSGLPFKFAGNASVVRPVDPRLAYFHTDLDVFGGNSGSPVFNADTGLIIGVHVRSETGHFLPTFEGCNTYTVRPAGVGRGGEVTKIGFAAALIPPTPDESAAQASVAAALDSLRGDLPRLAESVSFGE